MQFSCDECQAKYQIADERAAGRTLKMTCKHCGHVIYIRGAEVAASASPEPEAAPALPALRSSAPVWHVGIDDVPVGPLPLEEIRAKITAGAITALSPCWREGLDDWTPLGEIPELAELLTADAEEEPAALPARAALGTAAEAPAEEDAPTPTAEPAEEDAPPPAEEPAEEDAPTRAEASTGDDGVSAARPAEPAAPPRPAPPRLAPDEPPAPPPKKESRAGRFLTTALVGLVCGAAGYYAGLTARPPEAPLEAERDAPEDENDDLDEPSRYAPPARYAAPAPVLREAPAPEPAPATAPAASRKPTRRAATSAASERVTPAKSAPEPAPKKPEERPLTAEEKRLLESYGGSTASTVGGSRVGSTSTGTSGSTTGSATTTLDAATLQRVVSQNKAALQQCHERATRGMPLVQEERITVSITVGASGIVTRAIATGAKVTGLDACVEAAVKRWQFPSGGEARFPVVFPAS